MLHSSIIEQEEPIKEGTYKRISDEICIEREKEHSNPRNAKT